jgi:hypothetical protein
MPSSTNFKPNEKIQCPCGGSYSRAHRAVHMKTKKCLTFHTPLPEPEDLSEFEPSPELLLVKQKIYDALKVDIWEHMFLYSKLNDDDVNTYMDLEDEIPALLTDEEDVLYEMEKARLKLNRWEHILEVSTCNYKIDLAEIDEGVDYTDILARTKKFKTDDQKIDYITELLNERPQGLRFLTDATMVREKGEDRYWKKLRTIKLYEKRIAEEYAATIRQGISKTFVYPY